MQIKDRKPQYKAEPDGSFWIKNYSEAKPFANFLPGIAGVRGIPLWTFYVNRGQGIASFGVQDKDHAIMQFFPANRSYEQASLRGFRTFIKVQDKNTFRYYEPFQNHLSQLEYDLDQTMRVTSGGFSIQERNLSLGLEVRVEYFGVPQESFGALARKVTIKNVFAVPVKFELLDGLAVIVPYGLKEFFLKDMSRTVEAWMQSDIMSKPSVAMFKLKSDPEDRPEFQSVDGAHFYASFADAPLGSKKSQLTFPRLIVDPDVVFGSSLDLTDPRAFLKQNVYKGFESQITENKTPCAMSSYQFALEPQEEIVIHSYIGETTNASELCARLPKILTSDYFAAKQKQNDDVIREIKHRIFTVSGAYVYDQYCQQTFLDNVLRGGIPYRVSSEKGDFFFNVFSRKHGDLERDYNRFVVQPTFYSQGEGNFRDVNQNRRNDVWFEPGIRDMNVKTFFNLIQLDGYNPLVVEQLKLSFGQDAKFKKDIRSRVSEEEAEKLLAELRTPRTPGQIFQILKDMKLGDQKLNDVFSTALRYGKRWETARHGEGFWADHWTYNLDLLESYLEVHPEELENALLNDDDYTFYDDGHRVRPRAEKYVRLTDGRIRQYGSVYRDAEKQALIDARTEHPDKVRTRFGKGNVYSCSLLAKMLVIIANKYSSLDPSGMGLEMEADKPDWYDANNGLPGMFGSTLSGSFELKRWMAYVVETLGVLKLPARKSKVAVPVEVAELLKKCDGATRKYRSRKTSSRDLDFWNRTHEAKEAYWEKTRFGVSGKEVKIPFKQLKKMLELFVWKLSDALDRVYDASKETCPTYLSHEVTAFKEVKAKGCGAKRSVIVPKKFSRRALPLFLEGPVHQMKTVPAEKTLQVYDQVRKSDLFDRQLGMYTVTASLLKESPEIGRARVFSPGWLENQSVFLHMEYKWLLELLRRGLYNEFFTDFKQALVAFQDPKVYGRSVYENSSFIASSAFPNDKLHGTGFVARLSGSTAEFVDMWLKMNLGAKPFRLNAKKKLELHFNPVLPEWMFTKEESEQDICLKDEKIIRIKVPKSSFAFMLFGTCVVRYYNPRRLSTFGTPSVSVKRMQFHDAKHQLVRIEGNVLSAPYAVDLRAGLIRHVDVELG